MQGRANQQRQWCRVTKNGMTHGTISLRIGYGNNTPHRSGMILGSIACCPTSRRGTRRMSDIFIRYNLTLSSGQSRFGVILVRSY